MKYILILLIILPMTIVGQHKAAYQIFNAQGDSSSFDAIIDSSSVADIILFGESHNNPISHWLQYELITELNNIRHSIVIGLEMFERDQDDALQMYMSDSINYEELDSMIKLWGNFETDYKPIIDFAKKDSIPVVATNVPRRFASLVYKGGYEVLDSLSSVEKSWIAPIPFPYDKDLPGYKKMLSMFDDPSHANPNLPKAQAIKDATMAHSILNNKPAQSLFIHLNGSYHSDNEEGIMWYLRQYDSLPNILSISTVEQKDTNQLEEYHRAKADFIIVVHDTMTKTY